jgi:hypothetical protein
MVTKSKSPSKQKNVLRKVKVKTYKSKDKEECLTKLKQAHVEAGDIGQTARHFFYKSLGFKIIELIPNVKTSSKNAYAFICRLLVEARKKGDIPWRAVIDPGRSRTSYYAWDLKQYARATIGSSISLDFWRGQPQRLEIWVEKEAMAQIVNAIVRYWRIPVNINKGYGSATVIHDAAMRYGKGKGWTLLYIGDFDPSGLDIDRALRDGLKEYGSRPNIVRVSLTYEDTIKLIPMQGLGLKTSDARYKKFVELYTTEQKGYEIDSLPVSNLKQKLLEALSTYMDLDLFKKVVELEKAIDTQFKEQMKGALGDLIDDLFEKGVPDSSLPLTEQHLYLLAEDKLDELGKAIKEAEASHLHSKEEETEEDEDEAWDDDEEYEDGDEEEDEDE